MDRLIRTLLGFAALASLFVAIPAAAQDITKVEEDWEVDIDVPGTSLSSPQLTFLMSPVGDTSAGYVVFTLNERTSPDPVGGGMQLQLWNGGSLLSVSTASNTTSLNNSSEKIQWTQRLTLGNQGVLTAEIDKGSSATWGKFPANGQLTVSAQSSLTNLNSYDPNVSTANAGIDFGNARVNKIILRKVRTYTNNQKSVEQVADRVVYQR
ncbi:MAG: hypothetical protein HYX69_10540 [Planctomycetia bacterium]|nr:hypothetical protein [Planctomycetia bacterium]